MEISPLATHLITFFVGLGSGAIGEYYAQILTERRHAKEKAKKRNEDWQAILKSMPALVQEMHEDWKRPERGGIKTFYTLHEGCHISPSSTQGFVYYYGTHPNLDGHTALLEELGYIQFAGQEGVIREFRVSQELVNRICSHQLSKTDEPTKI